MSEILRKFDSALESRWVSRIKDARDLLLIALGAAASIFVLLRQPDVEISQSTRRLAPPRKLSEILRQPDAEKSVVAERTRTLLQASALVTIRVRNVTSHPISMEFVKVVGAARVVDYAVEWGAWGDLIPEDDEGVYVACCGDGTIDLPFLRTLPPRSTARISLWILESAGSFAPKVLAKSSEASIAVMKDSTPTPLSTFVDQNKVRISMLVLLALLWRLSRRLENKPSRAPVQ